MVSGPRDVNMVLVHVFSQSYPSGGQAPLTAALGLHARIGRAVGQLHAAYVQSSQHTMPLSNLSNDGQFFPADDSCVCSGQLFDRP